MQRNDVRRAGPPEHGRPLGRRPKPVHQVGDVVDLVGSTYSAGNADDRPPPRRWDRARRDRQQWAGRRFTRPVRPGRRYGTGMLRTVLGLANRVVTGLVSGLLALPRIDDRPFGNRGAGRDPLRHAASGALWRDRDLPRLLRALQHHRRRRELDPRDRRWHAAGEERLRPRGAAAVPERAPGRLLDIRRRMESVPGGRLPGSSAREMARERRARPRGFYDPARARPPRDRGQGCSGGGPARDRWRRRRARPPHRRRAPPAGASALRAPAAPRAAGRARPRSNAALARSAHAARSGTARSSTRS